MASVEPTTGGAERQVTAAAAALVVAQLVVRGYLTTSGYLYQDDFVLQSHASRQPALTVDWLLAARESPAMPAAKAVVWATARWAPLDPVVVSLQVVALQAVASTFVLLMLRRLFGARPLVLVPLTVYLFAPLTLPSGLWWSAALDSLPLQAAMAAAVWAHVGHLTTGSRRQAAAALVAVVAGLGFSAQAVLVPPLLLGVTWVLAGAPPRRRLGRVVATAWPLWLGYVGVVVAAAAFLTRPAAAPATAVRSVSDVLVVLRTGVLDGFVPVAAGGPIQWQETDVGSLFAAPPGWMTVVAWVVTANLVGLSCWARPPARRAWAVLAGYLVADLVIVGLGATAAGPAGAAPATDVPVTVWSLGDTAVPLALAVGFAVLTPVGHQEPAGVAGVRSLLTWGDRSPGHVTFLLVDAFVVLCLVSTVAFGRVWTANPARPWVEAATTDLSLAVDEAPLLPEAVPPSVVRSLAYPDNLTPQVLAPLRPAVAFAATTPLLRTFDDAGHLVEGSVDGVAALEPPLPGCWRVDGGNGAVELAGRLPVGAYTLGLGYLSGATSPGSVQLGAGRPVPLRWERGLHRLYAQVTGGGSRLYLNLADSDAVVCVDDVAVGQVVP